MNIKHIMIAAIAALTMTACSDDEPESKSIFDNQTATAENNFDRWLKVNYVDDYNIMLKYKFEYNESPTNFKLVPAEYNRSVALAILTKHLWLETYAEHMGKDFIRTYCPRIIHFIGSPAYNSDGSITIGNAEGGLKVTLFNVNNLNYEEVDLAYLNEYYFHTMHHEFMHILHQTKNYPTEFNEVTPSDYQAQSWINFTDSAALSKGFITAYAGQDPQEDLCEIISTYITNTAEYWDKTLASTNEHGRNAINTKLEILRGYLKDSWGMDLDELRAIIQRRQEEAKSLDLQSLTIEE